MNRAAEERFLPKVEESDEMTRFRLKLGGRVGWTSTTKCALFYMSERLLNRDHSVAIALSKETSAHRFFAVVARRHAAPLTSIN